MRFIKPCGGLRSAVDLQRMALLVRYPTTKPFSRCAHYSSRPAFDLPIDGWQGVEVNAGFCEGFSVKEATAHFQPEGAG